MTGAQGVQGRSCLTGSGARLGSESGRTHVRQIPHDGCCQHGSRLSY